MSKAIKSQGTTFKISSDDADLTVYGSATHILVSESATIGEPSGEAADIDVTHLGSDEMEYLIGLPDQGSMQVSGNFVADDAGQLEMEAALGAQNRRWVTVTFSNGVSRYAKALCKKYAPSASVNSKVPFSSNFRISGGWTRL